MTLSTAKKSAILQLLNCLSPSSCSISKLKELCDGQFFVDIINSVFPEFLKETEKPEPTEKPEKTEDDGEDEDNGEEGNVIPITNDTPEGEDDADTFIEVVQVPGDKSDLQKFAFVQKFIDEHYSLKSEEIISYNQCVQSNELELAKVAIFLLSEVVKYFVQIKSDHLETLSHLDITVQEDLEECFNFFITERFKISKSETERVLRHPAKYKVLRSQLSPFNTPQRICSSKYMRQQPTSTPSDEDVINSPLKSFFESPIFKKEDMFMKNKELEKVRKALYDEEVKCEDLNLELKAFKKSLKEKDKEILRLKEEIVQAQSRERTIEENLEKKILTYKNQNKLLQKDLTSLFKQYAELTKAQQSPVCRSSTSSSGKRTPNRNMEKLMNELIENLKEKDVEINSLIQEKNRLKQHLDDALKAVSSYKLMLSEKNSSLGEEAKTPVVDENIRDFIEEDHRRLQLEMIEVRLYAEKLLEENTRLKEEKKNEQNQSVFGISSDHLSVPKCLSFKDLAEKEKLRSVEQSDSIKESILSPTEFSPLDSSVSSELKQPSTSIMWDGDPPAENSTEAVLWSKYNCDSQLENSPSVDCMDIESDLTRGGSDSVRCKDEGLYSNIQENTDEICSQGVLENTAKTDGASIQDESVHQKSLCDDIVNLLKGLSTNGSYKWLKTSPNGSNGRFPQLVLKMIESVIHEYREEITSQTKEIKELNCQLTKKCSLIREKEDEFNKLKSEYYSLEGKYQSMVHELNEIKNTTEGYQKNIKLLEKRLSKASTLYKKTQEELKQSSMERNQLRYVYTNLKKEHELLCEKYENKECEYISLTRNHAQLIGLGSKLAMKESSNKELKEKLKIYKSKNIDLEEKMKKYLLSDSALRNEVKNLKAELDQKNSCIRKQQRIIDFERITESSIVQVKHLTEEPSSCSQNVLSESSVTSHDGADGSILFGALRKTHFPFETQDEEDFLNESSLINIKEKPEEDRVEELKRRNSTLPQHLQSAYPAELPCEDLYVKTVEESFPSKNTLKNHINKKRKLDHGGSFKTPVTNRGLIMTPSKKVKTWFSSGKNKSCRPAFLRLKP